MTYLNLQKRKEYKRNWYLKHKEACDDSRRKSVKKRIEYINNLRSYPCVDCKEEYPSYVMDFDHNKGEKIIEVTTLAYTHGFKRLLKEIEKCEVVCANCHRIRTWKRRNGLL